MAEVDSRIAVYTGSFDPITLGHLNVIQRASRLVDRLIVGIGVHAGKDPLFTPDERVELVRRTTRQYANVEVRKFDGLAVRFVRECGARVMIRGVHRARVLSRPLSTTIRQSNSCDCLTGLVR